MLAESNNKIVGFVFQFYFSSYFNFTLQKYRSISKEHWCKPHFGKRAFKHITKKLLMVEVIKKPTLEKCSKFS